MNQWFNLFGYSNESYWRLHDYVVGVYWYPFLQLGEFTPDTELYRYFIHMDTLLSISGCLDADVLTYATKGLQ